jgi:hypothetical protein
MRIDKKEVFTLVGAALILGFVTSYTQWGYGESVNYAVGIANWIRAAIIAFIAYSVYLISTKSVARLHGATSTLGIWGIERFWFSKSSKISKLSFLGAKFKTFKAGLIFPLLFSILSSGLINVATIAHTKLNEISSQRAGKKYTHLTDFEVARIHLAGPLACLFLAIVLSPLDSFNNLVEISKIIAIYSFVPLGNLDGTKILFGSIPLYLFGLIFTILSLLLINMLTPIATIVWSILTAFIILLIYLYRTN